MERAEVDSTERSKHGAAKQRKALSDADLLQAIARVDAGESQVSVAKVFGVSQGCISSRIIKHRKEQASQATPVLSVRVLAAQAAIAAGANRAEAFKQHQIAGRSAYDRMVRVLSKGHARLIESVDHELIPLGTADKLTRDSVEFIDSRIDAAIDADEKGYRYTYTWTDRPKKKKARPRQVRKPRSADSAAVNAIISDVKAVRSVVLESTAGLTSQRERVVAGLDEALLLIKHAAPYLNHKGPSNAKSET